MTENQRSGLLDKAERFQKWSCRVTRCRGEILGFHRSVICSIGDVFGGSPRFCVISRVFEKPEICAARTAFFLDFCAKVKEETSAYSPGPPYGRIKKLPVRISVRTAKQCRLFFNFSSIFKGKQQQFDAIL